MTVPPPTPNSALNTPAAVAMTASRASRFVAEQDTSALRLLRIRIEDKGPISAFHWRGVPDEDAARTHLEGLAQRAEPEGLSSHWGRKVLEIRPPVPIDKGQAVVELVTRPRTPTAPFGGDAAPAPDP